MHSYEEQTKVFYILKGEGTITINAVDYPARPGDNFICSPGDAHNLWNKTKEVFRLVVFKISLPEEREDSHWHE